MLKFIDENKKEYLVQAEFQTTNGVNGERSISGTIHSNETVIHAIGRGWKLEFEDEFYCITYALPADDGKDIIVEFDAIHEFFYDFEKSVIYQELNGSHTFDAYLRFIFDGTGYSYRVDNIDVLAFEKQSFGFKNRLALFKDVISSTGVEFTVSGKVVRIVKKVGTDLSTIVKKGFNLQDLQLEHNIGDFITYKKGYGAYFDEEDHSKGRLEVEYMSPLADVYGKLEGDPIMDERYTIKDNLLTRLKNEVDNSYSIAVSLSMEDLNEAGYEQERPHAGDYIMAINEDVDFQEKVRIVSFTSSFGVEGGLIDHQVSCNSMSMSNRQSKSEKAWKSDVQANLENAVSVAEGAAISANGKNMTFYGLFGPDGKGEPKATKKGDTWYKPVGEETEVFYWDGQSWEPLMSTKDNKIIQDKIEEVETEVEKSKKESERALKEAEEARKQAFNSDQLANSAKQDAILAIQKGNHNESQITKLENGMQLTNSKVDGNTAQISTLKSTNDQLSSTIMKTQADLDGMVIGNRNYFILSTSQLGFIDGAGNIASPDAQQKTTDFIIVDETDEIILQSWAVVEVDNMRSWHAVAYFDADKKIIGRHSSADEYVPKGTFQHFKSVYKPPKNTKFIRASTSWMFAVASKTSLTKGNKAVDWTPAPEDLANQTEFSSFVQTSKGFQQTTQSDISGIKSQQTQMDGQITSTVEKVNSIKEYHPNLMNFDNSEYGTFNETMPIGSSIEELKFSTGNITRYRFNEPAKLNGPSYIKFVDNSKFEAYGLLLDKNNKFTGKNTGWFKEYITPNHIGSIIFLVRKISNDAISKDDLKSFKLKVEEGSKFTGWESNQVTTKTLTQITQLQDQIDLRVEKNGVVTSINLSPEVARINAKWIHLSGTSLIDNAVIKSAHIDSIVANKITTGTLNASNVNIINMNASNIVTGTISGTNLRINLNTGEVLFNKGIIKKTDDSFVIDLDKGYITNKDPRRLAYFLIKDGGVKFYDRNIFSTTANPVEYGSIQSERQAYEEGSSKRDGEIMVLSGRNGVTLQTLDFDRDAYFNYRGSLGSANMNTYTQTKGNYLNVFGGHDWDTFNKGEVHLFSQKATRITSGSFGGWSRDAVIGRSGLHLETSESNDYGETEVNLRSNWYQRSGSNVTLQKHSYLKLKSNGDSRLETSDSLFVESKNHMNFSTYKQYGQIILKATNNGSIYLDSTSVSVTGSLRVTGSKNAIHQTSVGWVATPAYETAESYLGDIGTGVTDSDGNVKIFIDKLFNETINTKDYEYQVFLQSYSFGSNVFVIIRNEKYFVVKSEKPATEFVFEIKARRKNYENDRLEIWEENKHAA